MTTIDVSTPDGQMPAHLWLPEAGSGPGILLVQEIFGVSDYIKNRASDLAAAGYVVLAPELYLPLRNLAAQFHASADGLAVAARLLDVLEEGPVRRAGSAVPPSPGVAPRIATALSPKTRGMSRGGRDSQSTAFLRTPGTELLYSGVASRSPSAAAMRSLSAATAAGMPCAASASPS